MRILAVLTVVIAAGAAVIGQEKPAPAGKPAADAPPTPAPAATPTEAAAVPEPVPATPEATAERIEALLNEEESDAPQSEEQVLEYWKQRLPKADYLIAEFRKRFAGHPLRWKVLFLEANVREIREELELPIPKGSRSVTDIYAEIIAAPDADATTKADASSARLLSLTDEVSDKKLAIGEWEKQLATHLKSFPEYGENMMLVEMRLVLVEENASNRLVPLLEELAKSSNAEIATLAQGKLNTAKAMAELKSKPLDLKFKAIDGTEVDIVNLRGKVVLVDFWATWCGPCMAEVPNVVRTYEKLKGKGFEIIGISLDEDEAELKRVLKAKNMTWPQYFDGSGWENPYAKKYGIDGIPAMWLVNKKGMVVETNAHDDLTAKVEKLLGE